MDNKMIKILKELKEIQEMIKREFLKETTQLKETNTPEFKEGLVVYFSSLPETKLSMIEKKLREVVKLRQRQVGYVI